MATPTSLPSSFTDNSVLTATQLNNLRGAFRILQVVYGSYSTQTSSSSSTYADTGLTASITPQATSSKILVLVNQVSNYKTTNNTYMKLRLVRGSTEIALFESYGGFTNSVADNGFGACSISYLDAPATTAATTYKTQFLSNNNNAAVYTQTGGAVSTIILAEVSA